ncbi:hypothetical protein BDY19DRAFT_999052 [Irpex rosettiformis]|uniref:Uncharacterized protein n=1 Tax=Irpex rosettiformis TaxID=378272 RepID=A0ACB8TLV9_9APHY|nr:hypothetical protein BDY19DRAFT_999052 [Irpex rosettiformis]
MTSNLGYSNIRLPIETSVPKGSLSATAKLRGKKTTGGKGRKRDAKREISESDSSSPSFEKNIEEESVGSEGENSGQGSGVGRKRGRKETLKSQPRKKTRTTTRDSKNCTLHKTAGERTKETGTDRGGAPNGPFNFQYSCTAGGPGMVERDVDRMRRWMLLSSPHFYTYPHHDAAGLVTWTTLLNGLKIWSYVLPKQQPRDMESASEAYVEVIEAGNHIVVDTENRLPELATCHNFFLFPNTLLIQPPGLIHQVLTVEKSVTQGGHLLTWDTMHLTEWTRKLSHVCSRIGTNDLHPGVQRTLGLLKRPFISLARLVIHADHYWRGDYDQEDDTDIPSFLKNVPENSFESETKETWNERVEAVKIAKAILDWNGIRTLNPLDDIVDINGEPLGWEEVGEETNEEREEIGEAKGQTAWFDVGNEYLYIPKFPHPFL